MFPLIYCQQEDTRCSWYSIWLQSVVTTSNASLAFSFLLHCSPASFLLVPLPVCPYGALTASFFKTQMPRLGLCNFLCSSYRVPCWSYSWCQGEQLTALSLRDQLLGLPANRGRNPSSVDSAFQDMTHRTPCHFSYAHMCASSGKTLNTMISDNSSKVKRSACLSDLEPNGSPGCSLHKKNCITFHVPPSCMSKKQCCFTVATNSRTLFKKNFFPVMYRHPLVSVGVLFSPPKKQILKLGSYITSRPHTSHYHHFPLDVMKVQVFLA